MSEKSEPISGDIFCGVGGMSLGFEQAGFDVAFAIDFDPIHTNTYSQNFPSNRTICADVSKLSADSIRQKANLEDRSIDVLFGGPPCEGFSMIGKRNSSDPRNFLLSHFARLIAELGPNYFVVENVRGILIGDARNVVAEFLRSIRKAGYAVVLPIKILDASDFGVPQRRERVFILGYKKGICAPEYPFPKKIVGENGSHPTVWDAIGDLPNVDEIGELHSSDVYCGDLGLPSDYAKSLRYEASDSENSSEVTNHKANCLTGCSRTAHSAETVRRFKATKPGTYERISSYYRLTKNGLANTLRSGSDKEHGSYTAPRPIHPIYPRCITVREAARLHSFPDWFRFHSTKWHGFRQVGNSVPPLLAQAVAQSIYDAINKTYSNNRNL